MGIKFNCPNGHKLNVKSFLAGKKGVCPHCGAKFRIPSTPAEDDHEDGPALDVSSLPVPAQPVPAQPAPTQPATGPAIAAVPQGASHAHPAAAVTPGGIVGGALPVGQAVVPPGAGVQPQPAMVGAPAVAVAVRPAGTAVGAPVGMAAGVPVGQVVPAGYAPPGPSPTVGNPVMPAGAIDPIAENPNAVWYVRPPSGGQYGPARGDIMRKWIAEGRVTGTSLVWRDGWPDWRNAAEALPELRRPAATPAEPAVPLITPAVTRSTSRYVAGRKKSNALAITALVLLTILCLVMVGVLVVVLGGVPLGQPAETDQASVPLSVPYTSHFDC